MLFCCFRNWKLSVFLKGNIHDVYFVTWTLSLKNTWSQMMTELIRTPDDTERKYRPEINNYEGAGYEVNITKNNDILFCSWSSKSYEEKNFPKLPKSILKHKYEIQLLMQSDLWTEQLGKWPDYAASLLDKKLAERRRTAGPDAHRPQWHSKRRRADCVRPQWAEPGTEAEKTLPGWNIGP